MSKIGSLILDIQESLEQDNNPVDIARRLNIPIMWVYEVSESIDNDDSDLDEIAF
jgi:hypothetical protein